MDRLKLLLMPPKHQPDLIYLRHVPLRKVHLFTFIQILCLALLWILKSTVAAIIFPVMVRRRWEQLNPNSLTWLVWTTLTCKIILSINDYFIFHSYVIIVILLIRLRGLCLYEWLWWCFTYLGFRVMICTVHGDAWKRWFWAKLAVTNCISFMNRLQIFKNHFIALHYCT